MGTIVIYEYNREQLEQHSAAVMLQTVCSLVQQGLLNKDKADEFIDTHTPVIVHRQSLLDRLAKLLFKQPESSAVISIVKVRDKNEVAGPAATA